MPPATRAIAMSSRFAVSEPCDEMIPRTLPAMGAREGWRSARPRTRSPPIASIQATLPRIVVISPLWASPQNGWARIQAVEVFVQ